MRIMDLAKAIAPECEIEFIGIRPGEKIHECLLTEDEARHSIEFEDFFVIEPEHPWWNAERLSGGKRLTEGFRYNSDTNTQWLSIEELKKMVENL
jgi:UDP-N-acetylglucosamine 4,6-dehydratase